MPSDTENNVLSIARASGREVVPVGGRSPEFRIRCPWSENHENGDRRPSCRLNPEKNTFYCDVCQKGGGARKLARLLGVERPSTPSRRSGRKRPQSRSPRFVPRGPVSESVRRQFAEGLGKDYPAEAWEAFGAREGSIEHDGAGRAPEPVVAFPVAEGGWHVYRFGQKDRKRRWLFTDGGRPALLSAGLDRPGPILLTEGEWDALRAYAAGFPVATGTGGAGSFPNDWAQALAGRDVAVVYDVDRAGRNGAKKAAVELRPVAASVRDVVLPLSGDREADGKDLSDYLAQHDASALRELIDGTLVIATATTKDTTPAVDNTEAASSSAATRLVQRVLDSGVELFHDQDGEAYAAFPAGDGFEVLPCEGGGLESRLRVMHWKAEGGAPLSETIRRVTSLLSAQARIEGCERSLGNRVALHDGALWYALGGATPSAVRISAGGWEIMPAPILFARQRHQLPQVPPREGGRLDELLDFTNVRRDDDRLLLLTFVVAALVPDIPHPILIVHGPHGSAKTTLLKLIGCLIDPSRVGVMAFPTKLEVLSVQLLHHWLALYDNASTVPDDISDALCRAVTGTGHATRTLYSTKDETFYAYRRCIAINGINVAGQRPDLLDRALLVRLEPISDRERRSEEALWDAFEARRPYLLGALFDTVARAIALRSDVRLETMPRLADFALWGCAIAEALGFSRDRFLEAYESNRRARHEEVLAAEPIAMLLPHVLNGHEEWVGPASDLLRTLRHLAVGCEVDVRSRDWPKAPHSLTRRLNVLQVDLAAIGIVVDTQARLGDGRGVRIHRVGRNSVQSVQSVDPAEARTFPTDAIADASEIAHGKAYGENRESGAPSDAPNALDAFSSPSEEHAPDESRSPGADSAATDPCAEAPDA